MRPQAEDRARYLRNCRLLAALSAATGLFYLQWLLFQARPANPFLYAILLVSELFMITQAAGFWYTIWVQRWSEPEVPDFSNSAEKVDVFVTVFGEPLDVVEATLRGARAIRHPRYTVWLLDDGGSAEMEDLARKLGVRYVTRDDNTGAKAGNINHALERTEADFVAVFDADHVPYPAFLEKTLGAFSDASVAFVQTPQSYRNRAENAVAAGAHEQQLLFYGPILRGKDAMGAVFSCGTNVVFRRSALEAIGRIPEDSITEDLRMSLVLRSAGWTSVYVPEVLAEGLGPVDVQGFFKQQLRWARGGLEILFRRAPFSRRMRLGERAQYGLSFIFWFTGWAYFGYVLLPIAFLFFGLRPVQVPNEYPSHFLPYILSTLFTMAYSSGFTLTFRGLWFTLASFPVHFLAFFRAVVGGASGFAVTSKGAARRSLAAVWPQALTVLVLLSAVAFGLATNELTPSLVNNIAFAFGHVLIVSGFVRLAIRPERVTSGRRSRWAGAATGALLALSLAALVACGGIGPSGDLPGTGLPLADKVGPAPTGAYFGVYAPPAPFEPTRIEAFEDLLRKDVGIVMWYQPWAEGNHRLFDPGTCSIVIRRGKVPLITWEPWDPGTDANLLSEPASQTGYRLSRIVSGEWDPYIRQWARDARDFGGPIMLRPMHEMNGYWYPWCGTVNGNRPEDYVLAWRRIHDIFQEEGATNVTWVWSINHLSLPRSEENTFGAYYPGDDYVDWTAVSGFNWGTAGPGTDWVSWEDTYRPVLEYLHGLGKPVCVAEIGSVEQGGDKAAWVLDAYYRMTLERDVKAVVHFETVERGAGGRQDWRAATSTDSLEAYRAAVGAPAYISEPPQAVTDWLASLSDDQLRQLRLMTPRY